MSKNEIDLRYPPVNKYLIKDQADKIKKYIANSVDIHHHIREFWEKQGYEIKTDWYGYDSAGEDPEQKVWYIGGRITIAFLFPGESIKYQWPEFSKYGIFSEEEMLRLIKLESFV